MIVEAFCCGRRGRRIGFGWHIRSEMAALKSSPKVRSTGAKIHPKSEKKVVKPNFTTDFPEAFIREGADELILRAEGEGSVAHPSLTPRMWVTVDGGLRSSRRIGMASVRPFSKVSRDQNGKPCATSPRRGTKRSNVRNLEKTIRPRRFGF